jgi:hypothetical protein
MTPDDFMKAVCALARENGFGVTKLHFVSPGVNGAVANHEYGPFGERHASSKQAADHVVGTLSLRVDTGELDEVTRKAERLAETLDRVQAGLSSLTGPVS